MPPVMMTWVDADGDDADHRDLQDHDLRRWKLNEEALALEDPAEHLEDQRDGDEAEKDVQFRPGACAAPPPRRTPADVLVISAMVLTPEISDGRRRSRGAAVG